MSPTKSNGPQEPEVVRIWQNFLQFGRQLDDCEGCPVEIIYPGRFNDGQGGDFRDALVNSGDTCKSGDIEIHTRSSLWEAHGHHRNPVYNRVILHVALEQDRPGTALLQNGQTIPTIILKNNLNRYPHKAIPLSSCQAASLRPDLLKKQLIRAGEQRFFERAWRYQGELNQVEPGQSLYQGMLEALGYTKNKQPFLKLARRVPLCIVEDMANAKGTEEEIIVRIQDVLCENAATLDWELYKVRPDNSPLRRIMALSHLLYRYRTSGWLTGLMSIIHRTPVKSAHKHLEPALMVGKGYPALLGRSKAAEIIINAMLPFAWSWGQKNSKLSFMKKVIGVYRNYPRSESNSIERHMLRQLSLDRCPVNSACCQQGLIHIYKTLCTQGKCQECIFSYA